jgi:deoxyribodipyrimidine photo-lyase
MNVLVWLKRDLRLFDHPALTAAQGMGAILPLYIVEPDLWAQPDQSARHWAFLRESLADLRAATQGRLIVRTGEATQVLAALCKRHRIQRILSHEETGNGWTYARDQRVAAWAKSQGIDWQELPQSGVIRRLQGRDGWAGQRDAFMARPASDSPALEFLPNVEPGPIPLQPGFALPDDRCPHRQTGGRSAALSLLDSFLHHRGETYQSAMSAPLTAERACSRLSPHIATGTLSLREVVQITGARQDERPPGRWGGSLRSFQARLAWRDHFMQKLEDQPDIEIRCLDQASEGLRESDAARLQAWTQGETGLPFVDACMRYLRATGWLNFRMRAMLVSVASYHLWLDWRQTGAVLARLFTDYEPGIHWPQMQMQSGTTGINTPRIYNPVKQGQDQDPTGAFTRRWLPELAAVPDGFLQEPWKWGGARQLLGRRYPEPVVDVASAARQARDIVFGARRGAAWRAGAEAIVQRHASRAARDRRFIRDPLVECPRQLVLDL